MPRTHYDAFTRATHWFTAGVIVLALVVGFCFSLMPDDDAQFQFFSTLNKSLGTLLLPVMLLRYGWRHLRQAPPYPPSMSAWNRGFAHVFHEVFYLLILCTSASGLLMLKNGFFWFWLLYIPAPLKDLELNYLFADLHTLAIQALVAMLLVHIAAVVWHYRRGRQAILHRMLPRRRTAQR